MNKAEQTYRLISVTDLNGNKKDEEDFYKERVGCIAKNIRTCDRDDGTQVVRADFIQNAEGRLIQLGLRTSAITEIEEDENQIKIYTKYSIYNFEKAELPAECYQDAANLIELHLTDHGDKFCKGYYYDEHRQHHALERHLHIGTFGASTVLVKVKADYFFGGHEYLCRYFIRNANIIEFYGTSYNFQPYDIEMLIHNESTSLMTVEFPNGSRWEIPAGESKQGDDMIQILRLFEIAETRSNYC